MEGGGGGREKGGSGSQPEMHRKGYLKIRRVSLDAQSKNFSQKGRKKPPETVPVVVRPVGVRGECQGEAKRKKGALCQSSGRPSRTGKKRNTSFDGSTHTTVGREDTSPKKKKRSKNIKIERKPGGGGK